MRLIIAMAALAAVVASTAPAAGADPVATASKSCDVGNERSYGTSYVLTISASGTSCRNAKKLIRAFHDCRQPPKAGRCPSVKGYSCSEKRTVGRAQYDSRVTCTKGSRTVKHTYSQFT